uniref:Uncharacterized protein n=1 Tax=Ciona savignyi TaxID=51511 RepID=H2Z2Y7_CIOSA
MLVSDKVFYNDRPGRQPGPQFSSTAFLGMLPDAAQSPPIPRQRRRVLCVLLSFPGPLSHRLYLSSAHRGSNVIPIFVRCECRHHHWLFGFRCT